MERARFHGAVGRTPLRAGAQPAAKRLQASAEADEQAEQHQDEQGEYSWACASRRFRVFRVAEGLALDPGFSRRPRGREDRIALVACGDVLRGTATLRAAWIAHRGALAVVRVTGRACGAAGVVTFCPAATGVTGGWAAPGAARSRALRPVDVPSVPRLVVVTGPVIVIVAGGLLCLLGGLLGGLLCLLGGLLGGLSWPPSWRPSLPPCPASERWALKAPARPQANWPWQERRPGRARRPRVAFRRPPSLGRRRVDILPAFGQLRPGPSTHPRDESPANTRVCRSRGSVRIGQ